jgi:hypothetical protein
MLYGAGSLFVQSKELNVDSLRGENLIHPLSIASFSLAFETNNIEAKALIDGKRQIVAAAISEDIATLTLTFEYLDWQNLQFLYDEVASVSTGVTLPQLKSKTATLGTGVAEVADADILAGHVVGEDILVYVASRGSWGDRKYLAAADVTVSAGKIAIDDIYAGAVIQYSVPKTYASIETIGVESEYDQFGKLMFQGVVSGTEFGRAGMGIIIPELSRISTPEITINGDLSELTLEMRASVPVGQRRPYMLYKLDSATV